MNRHRFNPDNRKRRVYGLPGNARTFGSAGFTLLEILVALVILSGGLVMVLRASNNTLGALGRSRENMRAGLLLRESMDEIRVAALAPQQFLRPGTSRFAAPYGEYDRELFFEAADHAGMPPGPGGLLELQVTVRRERGAGIRVGSSRLFIPDVAGD